MVGTSPGFPESLIEVVGGLRIKLKNLARVIYVRYYRRLREAALAIGCGGCGKFTLQVAVKLVGGPNGVMVV